MSAHGEDEPPLATDAPAPSAPFKVGDCVRLKSGGPVMTIVAAGTGLDGVIQGLSEGNIRCSWFNHYGTHKEQEFPVDTLKPVPPEEEEKP